MFQEELLADFNFVLTGNVERLTILILTGTVERLTILILSGTVERLTILRKASAWTNACFRDSNTRPLFYKAEVLTAHSRYFILVLLLQYTLTNINRLCVVVYYVNNSILLEFDVEYLSTLIYELWNVFDNQ
jgi:hypothetical protein